MSVDFNSIRRQFRFESDVVYFLGNGITPMPEPVLQAAHDMVDKLAGGIFPHVQANSIIAETRRRVAGLLQCTSQEIAFTRNTAEGIIRVAQSMAWNRGDEVIVSKYEYPSLVYPFLAQKQNGVNVVFAEQNSRRITVDNIRRCISKKTRLIGVSWPQFDNGQRCDLSSLSELCQEKGILLIVDPIQGLGSFRFDVKRYAVDFLSTGVQKGLLGMQGLGIFYCRHSRIDLLKFEHVGWGGLDKSSVNNEYSTTSYSMPPLVGINRFEEGCRNIVGIAALNASLKFIEEIGIEQIEMRIKELSDYLCEMCGRKGLDVVSPRDQEEWSGIVLVKSKKHDPYHVVKELRQHSILLHAINNCLLFGIHIYNNHEDIDRFFYFFDRLGGQNK